MENEQTNLKLDQIFNYIKLAVSIGLIAGGTYLGYDTFIIVKSVLVEPVSLKKWVDLRPAIMTEPSEMLPAPKPKTPIKPDESETSPLTLWVLIGYFSILLGILYSYILAKISIALITGGVQLLTNSTKKT